MCKTIRRTALNEVGLIELNENSQTLEGIITAFHFFEVRLYLPLLILLETSLSIAGLSTYLLLYHLFFQPYYLLCCCYCCYYCSYYQRQKAERAMTSIAGTFSGCSSYSMIGIVPRVNAIRSQSCACNLRWHLRPVIQQNFGTPRK